jgi:hypothetical protein
MNINETNIDSLLRRLVIRHTIRSYRESISPSNNPVYSRRYFNIPPHGGYIVNDDEYINDDLRSTVFLDVVTHISNVPEEKKNINKTLGTYKKIREADKSLLEQTCSICIDQFKCGEFHRNLSCNHVFHKKCIDRWFRKGKTDCPMCRTVIIS